MIPKILHQCSRSYEWEERQLAASAKKLMPDYEYRAWNHGLNFELVKKFIPQHLDAYLNFPQEVIRVDVARCLYMYAYGGIYFDTDYIFYKPVDASFLEKKCVIAIEEHHCHSVDGYKLGNAFLASEPRFQMWLDFVDRIFKKFREGESRIVFLSGPHALTLFLKDNPHYSKEISIFPSHIIYPAFAFAKLTTIKTAETIGAHLCWGSWRGKPFLAGIKSKLRRWLSALIAPLRVKK